MLQNEFEERMKATVDPEEYQKVIEPMYNESTLDKDKFCDEFRFHGDSELLKDYFKQLVELKEAFQTLKNLYDKVLQTMLAKSDEYDDDEMLRKVVCALGYPEVIRRKIMFNYELTDEDKKFICDNIK